MISGNTKYKTNCTDDQKSCRRKLRGLLLLTLLFLLLSAGTAFASAVTITGCRLTGTTSLEVNATAQTGQVHGSKCYLFALPFTGGSISASQKPLKTVSLAPRMTFSVKIKKAKRTEYLYQRFVVAEKSGSGYRIISNARYLSNPGSLASAKYAFPKAASKKGLQVAASMLPDATELNVQHAAINIVFTEMLAGGSECNKGKSYSYRYNGKTYWFRKSVIGSYDRQLKSLSETGTVVSAILLLGYRSDLKYLIPPAGRKGGHNFYAWNVSDAKARGTLSACLSYLANRYSGGKGSKGRIVNWIVGNEVANYRSWNYGGEMSLARYASLYADAFRLTYMAVTSAYSNARVYISLDHLWNTSQNGGFTGRNMLEAFVSALRSGGYIPWNLAYHPYSSPLHETKFWENKNQMLTASLTTPVINMGNLSVLTGYIKSNYGAGTRIILSEQGFTSVRNKVKEEDVQSAAIAYSYLLTESDDMVDSFIMNRHVDHIAETSAGLYLGLWTNNQVEWANKKKQAWNTFKYMDTNLSESVTNPSLGIIGADSWKQLIPNYSSSTYAKTSIKQGILRIVKGYKKRASLPTKWAKYGAASSYRKKKNDITVKRNGSANPNLQWGITQQFKTWINLSGRTIYTTVNVKGSKTGTARIRMRLYSGTSRFECFTDVPCGKNICIGASLVGWSGASRVTKIQVLVEKADGNWNKGASLTMKVPVAG